MGNKTKTEVKEKDNAEKKEISVQIFISENGNIRIESLDGEGKPLQNQDVENILNATYNNMRDIRVAEMAVELFKKKLS